METNIDPAAGTIVKSDRTGRFRGITPRSKLGNALAYAAKQLPHLEPCFMDGQIEFDNNLTENAIRPAYAGPGHLAGKTRSQCHRTRRSRLFRRRSRFRR